MKLTVQNLEGKAEGEIEVGFQLVEGGRGTQAVHDAVVAYRAAQRSGTANTKTVGEVIASNRKPWRQKGTGNARAGSFASPLWAGGGVVFGPKPRDYSKKLSKKTRKLALQKALSDRLKAGDVVVVEALQLDSPKTRGFVELLGKLRLERRVVVVAPSFEANVQLASRNVPGVHLVSSDSFNTYQALQGDKLLFTREGLARVEERLKD